MALIRLFEDDEYSCSHSTMVVWDSHEHGDGPNDLWQTEPAWLTPDAAEGGTFVVAGVAWMYITANSNDYHRVRLELHDAAPALDLAGWSDVAESPYGSATGWIGLDDMFGGEPDAALDLGAPGRFRVRVARRPAADEGHHYLLQFWPVPGDQSGPRQLRRDPDGGTRYWVDESEDHIGAELRAQLRWAGASARMSVAELARHLLLTPQEVRRGLLYEINAGRLRVEGDYSDDDTRLDLRLTGGRSRFNDEPVHPETDQRHADDEEDGDMEAVTGPEIWDAPPDAAGAQPRPLVATQLPMPWQAWGSGLNAPAPGLPLTPLFDEPVAGGSDLEGEPVSAASIDGEVIVERLVVSFGGSQERPQLYRPPWGAPPRAGYVSSLGQVVVPGPCGQTVLAELDLRRSGPKRALQTAAGVVVVTGRGEAVLIVPDGSAQTLVDHEVDEVALTPAGDLLVVLAVHLGRRDRSMLHAIDLRAGTRETWETDQWVSLVGLVNGCALINSGFDWEDDAGTLRWRPGEEPEALPWRVEAADARSGTLIVRADGRRVLIGPGPKRLLEDDGPGWLSPGAAFSVHLTPSRTDLRVRHARDGAEHMIALPRSVDVDNRGPTGVWESPTVLLLTMRHGYDHVLQTAAVRCEVASGTYERVEVGPWGEHGVATCIEPLFE